LASIRNSATLRRTSTSFFEQKGDHADEMETSLIQYLKPQNGQQGKERKVFFRHNGRKDQSLFCRPFLF
jgi:creatinine amidohydrolase/Fe(II)-dependent formamide hydrolase-like protein